jgi:uncharacterized membrane protein YheB (UPF0754 family)
VTKLQELLEDMNIVKALLEEAEGPAVTMAVSEDSLAQIAVGKTCLDVFCEIAARYQNRMLDEQKRQRFEPFLNSMTQENLLRLVDRSLSEAHWEAAQDG